MSTSDLFNRREALTTLAGAVFAAKAASGAPASGTAPFSFSGLEHIALAVPNTEKSVRFYTRLFGNTVMKEKTNPRHYVRAGSNYIAMAPPGQGQVSPAINHFCPGIVNFDLATAKRALDGQKWLIAGETWPCPGGAMAI